MSDLRAETERLLALADKPLGQLRLDPYDMADHIRALQAEIDRLTAENEALRKDAERYRWLRDKWHGFEYFRNATINGMQIAELSREVDAAMSRERG